MPTIVKNAAGEQCYKTYSGYKVPVSLYNSLKEHIRLRLKTFAYESRFTLRELCGEEYWQGITNNLMKRRAGMCFRTMLSEGDFAIEIVKFKSATKHYRLK